MTKVTRNTGRDFDELEKNAFFGCNPADITRSRNSAYIQISGIHFSHKSRTQSYNALEKYHRRRGARSDIWTGN
jgi:hypothetical protein